MKDYIKKFESLNNADDHKIDNPFTSYIVGQGNLVCGEPNKKLKLEGEQVVIVDVEPVLIYFNVNNEFFGTAQQGMTWIDFVNSDYYLNFGTIVETDGELIKVLDMGTGKVNDIHLPGKPAYETSLPTSLLIDGASYQWGPAVG